MASAGPFLSQYAEITMAPSGWQQLHRAMHCSLRWPQHSLFSEGLRVSSALALGLAAQLGGQGTQSTSQQYASGGKGSLRSGAGAAECRTANTVIH